MALGIEKARQHGIAAVALHNSHHIGRIGYWAEQCAAAGLSLSTLLAWSVFNGRAVPRSRQPLWHQSVLCGFPRKDNFPLLLDYATSAIAFGKTRVARHKGVPVPPLPD